MAGQKVKITSANYNKEMDSIPLLLEFNLKTYIPVINKTNEPVKLSEHILLFDKILTKFVRVPDVVQVRNAYNLDSNSSTISSIPIITAFRPDHHVVLCDDNKVSVQLDAYLLVVEKISGRSFKIKDSIIIRKMYNLQQPLSNITNQMQSSVLMDKQSSTVNILLQKPDTLNLNQLPDTDSSDEFLSQENSNTDLSAVKETSTSSKTKRRKNAGHTPRASWKHLAILRLIYYYKENMHVMNGNLKRHEEIWQDIADALAAEGHNFSHLQCEDKWKYLKKIYVETKDKNKESGTPENTCPYFNELDEIYGKSHSVKPLALSSNRAISSTSLSELSDFDEKESIPKKKSRISKDIDLWTETFRNDAAAREEARQKRHEELLNLQKEQMQTQNALLAKILEKL